MPTIPYNLNPGGREYLDRLEFAEEEGLVTVKCSHIELSIVCEKSSDDFVYPDIDSISKHTPAFTDHLKYGYTLGTYSEFFLLQNFGMTPRFLTIFLGDVEISVGRPTPLAEYIYDGYHVKHYHPYFDDTVTMRIHGVDAENIESYVLESLIKIMSEHNFSYDLLSFDLPEDEEYDEADGDKDYLEIEEVVKFKGPIKDLEPLRFYYNGKKGNGAANSFLNYYRVLEFYCFVPFHSEIAKLRRDSSINAMEFVQSLEKITNRDERGLVCNLISKIADTKLCKAAKKKKLIDDEKVESLSNALYDFRNSIVHAKNAKRLRMYSEPLFEHNSNVYNWRDICEALAVRAIETFGRQVS